MPSSPGKDLHTTYQEMLLEINTEEMKLKFTAFAFRHSKTSGVSINYRNFSFLICFSQHLSYTLYVKGTAECGRE